MKLNLDFSKEMYLLFSSGTSTNAQKCDAQLIMKNSSFLFCKKTTLFRLSNNARKLLFVVKN